MGHKTKPRKNPQAKVPEEPTMDKETFTTDDINNLLRDIYESFDLAMQHAGTPQDKIRDILDTVADTVTNNVF